uniref:Uncharacterized protein n=1 Tax=Catharus ustulatus TaxID=91951 RepID=A0A8C3VAC2_CATUS
MQRLAQRREQLARRQEQHRDAVLRAGQELLAQSRAQLERYHEESSTQLLGTRAELAQLSSRLEAARQDVLQWVRGCGVPKDPRAQWQQCRPQLCAHLQCGAGAKLGCTLWAELS